MAWVRRVRTASGATAVQIAEYVDKRRRIVAHVGSAHTDAELRLLLERAHARLADAGQDEFDLGLEPARRKARLVTPSVPEPELFADPAMIERICEELDVPLRERNRLHLAAGFAPAHPERPFEDLGAAQDAVHAVLRGMEPNPAVAVNARWDLLAANDAMRAFLDIPPGELGSRSVNMLRTTLHPDGLAPQIRNLEQWRAHVLRRVRRQMERTAADGLSELLLELESYGALAPPADPNRPDGQDLVVPLQLSTSHGDLALLYAATARALRALADARGR